MRSRSTNRRIRYRSGISPPGGSGAPATAGASGASSSNRVSSRRPDRSRIEVEPEAGTLRIRYGGAAAENGTLDFRVEVVIRLDGEQVCFDARLENRTANAVLREFQFPLIAGLALRPETALVTGQVCDGFRYPDIPALLDASHTGYMAQDNKARSVS